jgi:curli biogenesis system outer membrane secretion channel CsgG
MTGQVKDDPSLTGQTQKLEAAGAKYNGPAYTIGIIKFANKTPSKVLGIGEAATDILRTQLKAAGLEPIDLSEEALQQQEELIKLQQTGAVKMGKKSAAEGFESIDFRVQGAITAYSETEEGKDLLIAQSKTQIARVTVDYALIDVATGKSLLAESGTGEYRKETGGVLGFGSRSAADVGLRDGALRDAFAKVLEKMINKLNAQPFQSRIMLIEGSTVVIRAGEKSKLAPGTKLAVYRPGQDLIDPETGRSLGKREKLIGEITLVSHQNERISEAKITTGIGFQVGDIVRVMK